MPVIKSGQTSSFSAFSMTDIEIEAAALLEGAKRRAAAIVERARQEAQEQQQVGYEAGVAAGRDAGYTEGYQKGIVAGRSEAFAEHEARLNRVADNLETTLRTFNADRASLASRAQAEVTTLAIAIADRVCKRAAWLDPEVCRGNVLAALRLVIKASDVKLHINPDDSENIKSLLPAVGRKWPALAHVELVEDSDVNRGGCRVTTEGGMVDADLLTQLDRVAADLVPG